jgi:quercetin dioxygenase-like cupin family protein
VDLPHENLHAPAFGVRLSALSGPVYPARFVRLFALAAHAHPIRSFAMAISHAASGQVIDLLPATGSQSESRTVALFKSRFLEVMRLVLPEGKTVAPHAVKGDITVQCLAGEVNFFSSGEVRRLATGQMLWLEGGVEHSLTAVTDAQVLVTIALQK